MNDAVKRENLDDIKTQVTEIKKATGELNMSLNFLFWMRIIPFVGGYYADAQHFSRAAQHELNAAEAIVESLLPYKAELGFNGTPTPGQDRVAHAVKVLDKVLPQIDKVEPELK
jgi:glycine/D-amino acid oxidase-like deaminating enzyme